jgi:SAM-dependent methyltransferase
MRGEAPAPDPADAGAPAFRPAFFSNAEAYERYMGRWSRRLALRFVEFAGVRDGDRVLDVGSGTGALALAVAAQTQRSVIVGIEPSAAYAEYARTRTGDPRVRFEVGDALRLPYGDGSFDRTLAGLVLPFVPDAPRAVAEMRRVTRPGGTVAASVWDATGGMEMLTAFWNAAVALDPAAEPRRERHRPHSRPDELKALWERGGLTEGAQAALIIPLEFASFEDFWAPHLLGQGPAAVYLVGLEPERQAALRARLRRDLLGSGPDGPFTLRARAWAIRGCVPAR